jgi:hypothetical protein
MSDAQVYEREEGGAHAPVEDRRRDEAQEQVLADDPEERRD